MQSLVSGRETLVTRGSADILDLVQFGHFLLVQFWRLGRENLSSRKIGYTNKYAQE